MRRILVTVAVLGALPGCYTVLRHPAPSPSDASDSDVFVDTAPISPGAGNCAACHDDRDLDRFDYAEIPLWVPAVGPWAPWYCEPWWVDVVAVPQGTRVTQGRGLANDRPVPGSAGGIGPGVWIPPVIPAGTAVTDVPRTPISRSDPPAGSGTPAGKHGSEATPTPHDTPPSDESPAGAHSSDATPTPHDTPPAPRAGEPAPNPKNPPADTPKDPPARTGEPTPAPRHETKAPTKQGSGMRNDRPKPKP